MTNHLQNFPHFSQAHLKEISEDSSQYSVLPDPPHKISFNLNELTKQNIRQSKAFQT